MIDTYPWSATPAPAEWPPLLQLRPEDVGFDGYSAPREGVRKEPPQSDSDADPLVRPKATLKDAMCGGKRSGKTKLHLDFVLVSIDEHVDASEGGGDVVEPAELRQ